MSNRSLSEKQARFVEEYLADPDPAGAAERAGYARPRLWGRRLAAMPRIRAAVEEAGAQRSRRTGITRDRVVEELAAVGFAAISDVCRWDASGVSLVESGRLTREQAAAVAEITESGTGRGSVRIKLHAKLKALEMLGRHLGMFAACANRSEDEAERPLPEPLAEDLAEGLRAVFAPLEEENEE